MKRALILKLILTLLVSVVAGTQFVNLTMANPLAFPYGGDVPPDSSTEPPTITISSANVNGKNISIDFKASVGESTTAYCTYLSKVYYQGDWEQNQTYVYQFFEPEENIWDTEQRTDFSYKLNITAIPVEGMHTITVYVREEGGYLRNGYVYGFSIIGFSNVTFTIGTTSPTPTFTPEPTPIPHEVPEPSELELILGAIAILAVLAFGFVLLYRIKRK